MCSGRPKHASLTVDPKVEFSSCKKYSPCVSSLEYYLAQSGYWVFFVADCFSDKLLTLQQRRLKHRWMSLDGRTWVPFIVSWPHPIQHPWDGLERWLWSRPSCPTPMSDLSNVLLGKLSKIFHKHHNKLIQNCWGSQRYEIWANILKNHVD